MNTSGYSAYVSGGVVTPNFRNVVVSINDHPDDYLIPYVNPPQQDVTMTVTWNTTSPNFVSGAAIAQLGAPALAEYVNSIPVGAPINLFELGTPTAQGTAIDFATTQGGTTSRAVRMRLYGNGRLLLGASLPSDDGVNSLQVNGGAIATFLGIRPSNNLTATGSNQATALALTTGFDVLGTVAASTGVVLPTIGSVVSGGDMVLIDNAGSNAAKVYGSGAQTIDGVAGATGVTLTNAKRCLYIANTGSTWLSYQLGVPSA